MVLQAHLFGLLEALLLGAVRINIYYVPDFIFKNLSEGEDVLVVLQVVDQALVEERQLVGEPENDALLALDVHKHLNQNISVQDLGSIFQGGVQIEVPVPYSSNRKKVAPEVHNEPRVAGQQLLLVNLQVPAPVNQNGLLQNLQRIISAVLNIFKIRSNREVQVPLLLVQLGGNVPKLHFVINRVLKQAIHRIQPAQLVMLLLDPEYKAVLFLHLSLLIKINYKYLCSDSGWMLFNLVVVQAQPQPFTI